MRDAGSARGGRSRGQTLPDFAVGVALFLLAITFVVVFVPQVSLPYDDQEQPVVVERVASDLSGTLLANETRASKLNETCTLAFFNQTGGGGCPFDTGNSVDEQLGIASTYSVNVTLRDVPGDDPESALLCETSDYGSVTDCDTGTEQLGIGPPVPQEDDAVSIARRRVTVGGTQAVLEIGVW